MGALLNLWSRFPCCVVQFQPVSLVSGTPLGDWSDFGSATACGEKSMLLGWVPIWTIF